MRASPAGHTPRSPPRRPRTALHDNESPGIEGSFQVARRRHHVLPLQALPFEQPESIGLPARVICLHPSRQAGSFCACAFRRSLSRSSRDGLGPGTDSLTFEVPSVIRMANFTIEQKSNVILDAIGQRQAFDALGGRIHKEVGGRIPYRLVTRGVIPRDSSP